MLELDQVQTIAFGGLSLFAGFAVLRLFPLLARYNIPAPVIGGLLVALIVLLARQWDLTLITFNTGLQSALMTAFFTSIGFSASLALLKAGGGQVLLLLGLAAFFAVVQNVAGILIAVSFDLPALLGVLMGATTMAGGPATALAFAPLFEQAGVAGAESIAIAAAMAGIVLGGLAGGPVVTRLLERHRLRSPGENAPALSLPAGAEGALSDDVRRDIAEEPQGDGAYAVLKGLTIVLVAMWIGSWISAAFVAAGITLPGYVGAMLVGAAIRNLDDATGLVRVPHATTGNIGTVCLTLFLAVALMNLRLWELSGLALPLVLNLAVQVTLVSVFSLVVVYRVLGRDYDAAVMSGGFTGFMLGTTANAMAVMRTVVERFGPAPRAFLVAPLVGAFFIDFTNALIITTFLNLLG